jgi:hypothetical protein
MVYPGMTGEYRLELPACLHETIVLNVDHVAVLPCGGRVALPAGTVLEAISEKAAEHATATNSK